MNLKVISKAAATFFAKNGKHVVTVVSVAGVITTAVLASKATVESNAICQDEICRRNDKACEAALNGKEEVEYYDDRLPLKDTISLCWKKWLPCAMSAATTISCILWGNKIREKEIASLAALASYKIAEMQEYKKAVEGNTSEDIQNAIDKAFEKNKAENAYAKASENGTIIETGHGTTICIDPITGQVFHASKEFIEECLVDFCNELFTAYDNELPYSRFIELMGGNATKAGDLFIYTSENPPGHFNPSYDGIGPESIPAWVIKFDREPILDRNELRRYAQR